MAPKTDVHVASVLLFDGPRILLQKRKPDDSYPGQWENPGGKVEEGEELHIAAGRELEEELGTDIAVEISQNPVFELTLPQDGHRLVIHYFYGKLLSGTPHALASSEIRWCTRREFEQLEPMVRGLDMVRPQVAPFFKEKK